MAALLMGAGAIAGTAAPVHANLPIKAYACAYWANVNVYNSGSGSQGCAPQTDVDDAGMNSLAPSVQLPQAGGGVSAYDGDGAKAVFRNYVTVFSGPYDPSGFAPNSGVLSVSAQGGSTAVTATARAETVGPSPFWTRSPGSAAPYAAPANGLSYDGSTGYVQSSCNANGPTSKSGNVTVKNGFVDTHTDPRGRPTETVAVPNPTPINYRVDYTIDNVGDHGYIVFNERIKNADGSLTVNGAHMYMQGDFTTGDLIIAQVICGVS